MQTGLLWALYWFCSVDCYKKAVSKYIKDKRYGFYKSLKRS
ncbi:hypothetical protein GGD63_006286 [Bradyrhizobium sp. cir1]|nr:hypothetical protein [Bradyrhizobium sp. cir1]